MQELHRPSESLSMLEAQRSARWTVAHELGDVASLLGPAVLAPRSESGHLSCFTLSQPNLLSIKQSPLNVYGVPT